MLGVVIITVSLGLSVVCSPQQVVCDGTFEITNIEKCENPKQYSIDLDVKKRKINRTHDGISVRADLPDGLTPDIGLYLEAYTQCDGGYRFLQIYTEDSVCEFFEKYGNGNFERALSEAGIDPPCCPTPQGIFEFKNFVVDYSALQDQGMSGDYKLNFHMVRGPIKVACMIIYCTFRCNDDDTVDIDIS